MNTVAEMEVLEKFLNGKIVFCKVNFFFKKCFSNYSDENEEAYVGSA